MAGFHLEDGRGGHLPSAIFRCIMWFWLFGCLGGVGVGLAWRGGGGGGAGGVGGWFGVFGLFA